MFDVHFDDRSSNGVMILLNSNSNPYGVKAPKHFLAK